MALFTECFWGYRIRFVDRDETRSTCEKDLKCMQNCSRTSWTEDTTWKNKTTWKDIIKLDRKDNGYESMNCNFLALVKSYEYDNDPSGSIRTFFYWLDNYQILNKDSAPWSQWNICDHTMMCSFHPVSLHTKTKEKLTFFAAISIQVKL